MIAHSIYQQARLARDKRFDGCFFVAVKTTGIFCRPICPAVPPKEQNVEYFQQAELAMKAGYRPCLRCRPDSSPGSYAWKGVETSVERALKLLSQYPELSLKQIADKLGVTDRYLRKLFQERVGMAPKRYQLFQQLLFAKQLLHQTSLPIEQVALAAGFQSARRLQDNCKHYLQLNPAQIRGTRKAGQTIQLQLAFRPPYDWPHLRDLLALRAVEGMEWVSEDSYARTISYQGQQGHFHARYRAEDNCFTVDLELEALDQLKGIIAHIRRILDLDADEMVIGQGLEKAGLPKGLLRPGLRLPGIWDPFEAGCRAILGQQVSVKAAIGQLRLLVHSLGEHCARGYRFPTSEAIARADLAFLHMPQARRDTLHRFACYCRDQGEADFLHAPPTLKGIGPWTWNYIRLRGYSHPDTWLDTDLVVKKQLAKYTIDPRSAAPWRSYLTLQLWSLA